MTLLRLSKTNSSTISKTNSSTTSTCLDDLLKKCNSFSHIKQVQSHLITTGLYNYTSPRTKLLELLSIASFGNLSYATSIFHYIKYPTTEEWNAIIRGHAQSSLPRTAITCYLAMLRTPQKPDALTCSFTLKACSRGLARFEAEMVHSHVVQFGFKADLLLQTTLLDVYMKVGEYVLAQQLFDEMSRKDLAAWNALIGGLAQGSRPHEALRLFRWMIDVGLKANDITVLGALSACSQLGAPKQCEEVWQYVKDECLDSILVVCNAVIDMFSKCGFVDRAYQLFRSMSCGKNTITWNTMIMGFAMHGHGLEAIQLFEEMEKVGPSPDAVSYLAVLCACNHAGLVDEGIRLFDAMVDKGIPRNIKHFGVVVDLLGRAGRLQESYEIMNTMQVEPDVVLWQTLLGACKTYGNVDMAELASRKLVEMGSKSDGDFVLLSNVYAVYGRWNDVRRVREAMKVGDVKKVPGFSYTEVDGIIHKFINGDQNHPSCQEIYAKLDEIMPKVQAYGYVPGTKFVLHDIGEEDKEYALCYHSEKLAVAFGLLRTTQDTPIQVIKNLRICGDCHAVIKLISKIYDRVISVRDRTRFHRFHGGLCSCREYW